MSSLRVWSIVVILCQTMICVLIGWLTLNCRFDPKSNELYEVTLVKLMYLYDPEACQRVFFYNATAKLHDDLYSTIMWPVKNKMASSFRSKIRLWLCLHITWVCLSIANMTHGHRHCGFYAVVVPFTVTGLTLLVVDLIYTAIFLQNIKFTDRQTSIISFMGTNDSNSVRWINKPFPWPPHFTCDADNSWVSLLFAYVSCRGMVLWFVNFWMVKDNYYEGLAAYHRLQREKSRQRSKA